MKKFRERFCENDYGGCITSLEAIASIILFIYKIYVFLVERDLTNQPKILVLANKRSNGYKTSESVYNTQRTKCETILKTLAQAYAISGIL